MVHIELKKNGELADCGSTGLLTHLGVRCMDKHSGFDSRKANPEELTNGIQPADAGTPGIDLLFLVMRIVLASSGTRSAGLHPQYSWAWRNRRSETK